MPLFEVAVIELERRRTWTKGCLRRRIPRSCDSASKDADTAKIMASNRLPL